MIGMKTLDVVALFLKVSDEILLCKRKKAGKVETHETLENALIREIQEELSLTLKEIEIYKLGVLHFIENNRNIHFHVYGYNLEKKPIIALNSEHTGYIWCNHHNIKVSVMPRFPQAFSLYQQYHLL